MAGHQAQGISLGQPDQFGRILDSMLVKTSLTDQPRFYYSESRPRIPLRTLSLILT